MNTITLISIIVPVYNSENTLDELTKRIANVFRDIPYSFELILVDDGSNDNSWNKIETISKNHLQVIGVKLAKNFGQHSAILCGMKLGKGSIFITLDDDLQYPPEEIVHLIAQYEKTNADVVYGVPSNKNSKSIKNIGSYVVSHTAPFHDKNNKRGSSFRLLKSYLVKELLKVEHYNFIYLDVLINWHTANKSIVMVAYSKRKSGKSGYSIIKLIGLYLNLVFLNYSSFSLKITSYIGFIISFIAFLIGAYYIYLKLNYNVPIGYTSIIVAILFSTGVLLMFMSILIQFVLKIFLIQTKKPIYFIEKKTDHHDTL